MSSKNFRVKLIVVSTILIYSGFAKAEDVISSNTPLSPASTPSLFSGTSGNSDVGAFPLNPRLDVYGGTGNMSYGKADILAPLFGSSEAIFYTDVQGQINSNKGWLSSLGFGGRDTFQSNTIGGAYVFIDRTKSDNDTYGGTHWWIASPGLEVMSPEWDARINGYFPVGSDKELMGVYSGDQVNQPDAVSFDEHTEYSNLFSIYEEVGPGADADVGYTFLGLNRFRIHGGAYYFTPKDADAVRGGEVGAEMPINNHLAILVDDTFDNIEHNTAEISVRYTLGGLEKSNMSFAANVQERMLDPIRRNFSNFSSSRLSGSSVPVENTMTESNNSVPVRNNIWFFRPNGTPFIPSAGVNNCTYEHPCEGSDFTDTNINTINGISASANFYFNTGQYNIGQINLNNGQSMFGRTEDYTLPATPTNVAFLGSLALGGNNNLNAFLLLNDGSGNFSQGITATNTSNITISNVVVGAPPETGVPIQFNFAFPIYVDNAQNVTITDSSIFGISNATSDFPTVDAAGIKAINGSTVNATNNIILVRGYTIVGIDAESGSSVTANGNNFTITGDASQNSFAGGLYATGAGTQINATDNNFTINTGLGQNPSTFNINLPLILPNVAGGGVLAEDNATINLSNNNFTIHIINTSSPTIVMGAFAQNAGTINLNGGNIFNFDSYNYLLFSNAYNICKFSTSGGTINGSALFNNGSIFASPLTGC